MPDREKVIYDIGRCICHVPYACKECSRYGKISCIEELLADALSLLKEQEKKQITFHKKHVITWGLDDKFSMRELYQAVFHILLDEGELFIARTDDHEKVEFVFYVAEGR